MTRGDPFTALLLGAAVVLGGAAFAQKASVPKTPDKLALADKNAKEMLLLMDTDKNGKISKQEWMNFMSAEFDRLDVNKNGELDPKELEKSDVNLRPVQFANTGK